MEAIEIGATQYEVRQTDSPDKKWVQTDKGERLAICVHGIWEWKNKKKKPTP